MSAKDARKERRPAAYERRVGERDEVTAWLEAVRAEVVAAGCRIQTCCLEPRNDDDWWAWISYRPARRAERQATEVAP